MMQKIKKKTLKLSTMLLEMAMPYYGEFSPHPFRVFALREVYKEASGKKRRRIGKERYVVGEGAQGLGLYYSYNRTAVPIMLSESRICRLLGLEKYSDFNEVRDRVEGALLDWYTEIVLS